MVSEDFFKVSPPPPIIRKLITDPHGMAKLGPKKTVGTIYAGVHKTLLLIARGEGGGGGSLHLRGFIGRI